MSTITEIHAREILDSRGNPTVEAEVTLSSGTTGGGSRNIMFPTPDATKAIAKISIAIFFFSIF